MPDEPVCAGKRAGTGNIKPNVCPDRRPEDRKHKLFSAEIGTPGAVVPTGWVPVSGGGSKNLHRGLQKKGMSGSKPQRDIQNAVSARLPGGV